MMHRPDSDHYQRDGYQPSKMRFGGGPPSSLPFRERGERHYRNGPPPSSMRGGYSHQRPPMSRGSDYDKPDRPGYFAGSHRPFRMDKMRSEPLEKDERFKHYDRPGPSGKEMRDQRNRPSQHDRKWE